MTDRVQFETIRQGSAMALCETQKIIETIRRRAAENSLNRGLRLSLPYFDDKSLEIKLYDFQVIPEGRIPFIPAYVAYSCQEEQRKVGQDQRLSPSTREQLLVELETIAEAFNTSELVEKSKAQYRVKQTSTW